MAKKMMLKVVILVSLLIFQLADSHETVTTPPVESPHHPPVESPHPPPKIGANYRQGRIYAIGHAGRAARDAIAFRQALPVTMKPALVTPI
ncbi:unnamed protein product [Prunus armeniaca]|uniref:Uncharacterized protein n=1 Tax=Prunus armeniaca TaxID=36596 RepID=A0A6J5W8F7_PRUAR|nr:unnamed protein product [Prunus armeniaca]